MICDECAFLFVSYGLVFIIKKQSLSNTYWIFVNKKKICGPAGKFGTKGCHIFLDT